MARRFGAALVSGGDPAAEDRALRGLHPDLSEVAPEGAFTTIGQVRELVRLASGRPFEGARRVFVLEADTLNAPAANALLKTLESPEGEAVFVLLALSDESVLPTVVSRSRTVRFSPVPEGEVASFLRERGMPEDEARLAASLGRGSVGLALRYSGDTELRGLREAVLEAGLGLSGDFETRHAAVSQIVARAESVGAAREAEYLEGFEEPDRRAKDGAKRAGRAARDGAVRESLGLLALLYRDCAAVAAGAPELAVNVDGLDRMRRLVAEHPAGDWAGAAGGVGEARAALTYNVAPEVVLEDAISRSRRRILPGAARRSGA